VSDAYSILNDVADVQEAKNDDYGNSWRKAAAIKQLIADENGPTTTHIDNNSVYDDAAAAPSFALEAIILAETPRNESLYEQQLDGVFTRLLDKVVRAYTLTMLVDGNRVMGEGAFDAAVDIAGYAGMLAELIDERDTNE